VCKVARAGEAEGVEESGEDMDGDRGSLPGAAWRSG
jgi:hypothetical protein